MANGFFFYSSIEQIADLCQQMPACDLLAGKLDIERRNGVSKYSFVLKLEKERGDGWDLPFGHSNIFLVGWH